MFTTAPEASPFSLVTTFNVGDRKSFVSVVQYIYMT
jgi:hypothetical protein